MLKLCNTESNMTLIRIYKPLSRFLIWQQNKQAAHPATGAETEQNIAEGIDVITPLTSDYKWETNLRFKFPITSIIIPNQLEGKTKGNYNATTAKRSLIPPNKAIECCFYTNKCLQ